MNNDEVTRIVDMMLTMRQLLERVIDENEDDLKPGTHLGIVTALLNSDALINDNDINNLINRLRIDNTSYYQSVRGAHNVDRGIDEDNEVDAETSLYLVDRNAGAILYRLLLPESAARNRRPAVKFATRAQRDKFVEIYNTLGAQEYERLARAAIANGFLSRASILGYLKKCVTNAGKDARARTRKEREREKTALNVIEQLKQFDNEMRSVTT